MTSSKSTKRALISSILSIVLCATMLIGSTFAWFTDTASTGVNKIQAGNLDVALEMLEGQDWVNAEGKTLTFKTADNRAADQILWEPGCTYELPQLRVINKGNLALKYKIQITGIQGDAELNEAIDWTINDVAIDLSEKKLGVNGEYIFTIKGHMKETAGNEYQGLSIDGISITVFAAQDTVEYDSFNNLYDNDAKYPPTVEDIRQTYGTDGAAMPAGVEITSRDNSGSVTITLKDEEAFLYFAHVLNMEEARATREAALKNGTATAFPGEAAGYLNFWYYKPIYVELACDLDFKNQLVTTFAPNIRGFDGKGHTIKNATVAGGFFGSFAVTDVKMDNIRVFANGEFAGVVSGSNAWPISKVTVTNCTVTGGKYTGAITGHLYGNIERCVVENCVITGQYKAGGLVGYACHESGASPLYIRNNTLKNIEIKRGSAWPGKDHFEFGQVVGNWNSFTGGECTNTIINVTGATSPIGVIEPNLPTFTHD